MTAEIVPFPSCRRREFIRRHAAIMKSLNPEAAERHLSRQVAIQAAAMERRGIEGVMVEDERAALLHAIRVECLRLQCVGAA